MRVIGVGFGRTGTTSLKIALERLGFGPCYHMLEVRARPSRARDWLAVDGGAPPDWDAIFAGFDATVDWPGTIYWRELLAAYPKALAILTVRDPQRWYDSAAQTIFAQAGRTKTRLRRVLGDPRRRRFAAMNQALVVQRQFGGRIEDRAHCVATFERHNATVLAEVPAERLLVYDIADGWAPLCEFLDVPVPDEPFPRTNDVATFNRRLAATRRRILVPAACAAAGLLAAGAVTALRFGRARSTGTS